MLLLSRSNKKERGFLLVFILMMTVVILMMVGATLTVSRQSQYSTTNHFREVTALEAAEAGSVDIKNQLKNDRTWAPTSDYSITMPGGKSSYRVRFAATPTVDPDLSINNLAGENLVDGPRGPGTVPPHSAYVVVDGFAGESSRRLELIVRTAPFKSLNAAIVTSGAQYFAGDVVVTGIQDFDDITPAQADVHSNSTITATPCVDWTSATGDIFKVEGALSSAGDTATPFDLNSGPGTVDVQTFEPRAGNRSFPDLNIEAIIDNSSGTTFTPVAGVNFVPVDSVFDGSQIIQGDLVLQDTTLYVTGPLRVNGSITGRGSIFVMEDTEFSGAADVNVADGHVSLYSRGHVALNGFDGTEFLESQPAINVPLQRVKFALSLMASELRDYPLGTIPEDYHFRGKLDNCRSLLGQNTDIYANSVYNNLQTEATSYGIPPLLAVDGDSLEDCIAPLAALPSNPTYDRTVTFLLKKLRNLQRMSDEKQYPGNVAGPAVENAITDFLNNGTISDSLIDNILDSPVEYARAGSQMEGLLRTYSFDAIGTSYFKGVVYTNGAVHCSNEVEVVGGLYVEKNQFSPPDSSPMVTPDRSLVAGDVQFDGGSRITYVEGLLEQSPATAGNNLVTTTYWSVR